MPEDIDQRIWSLCDLLRDDGVSYQDYITELSWLLFLRLSEEAARPPLDPPHNWETIRRAPAGRRLSHYRRTLRALQQHEDSDVARIFAGARTTLRNAAVLDGLVAGLDAVDWSAVDTQTLGDVYEGLLERNAREVKGGAGQYFTPRSVVDLMIRAVRPRAAEVVQDPAAGTGGFLIAAHAYANRRRPRSVDTTASRHVGMELVPNTHRICLMNLWLHGVRADVRLGDTLSKAGSSLPQADVVVTNPPFGSKRGAGLTMRGDLHHPSSNKQIAFLELVIHTLRPGGRAAVVVPDGVLFEGGAAREVRRELLRECDLHTVLRLPTRLFYAQGVKTNVLFFDRPRRPSSGDATKEVWVYDARGDAESRESRALSGPLIDDFLAFHKSASSERGIFSPRAPATVYRLARSDVAAENDRLDGSPFVAASVGADLGGDMSERIKELRRLILEVDELAQDLSELLETDR